MSKPEVQGSNLFEGISDATSRVVALEKELRALADKLLGPVPSASDSKDEPESQGAVDRAVQSLNSLCKSVGMCRSHVERLSGI